MAGPLVSVDDARTTCDIGDDLIAAAKEPARREGSTIGALGSRLLRRSLNGHEAEVPKRREGELRATGLEPLPVRPGVITTDELVDAQGDTGRAAG